MSISLDNETYQMFVALIIYNRNLTNKTSVVPKLANSLFTSELFVASNAAINFATCSLVLPSGGSRAPTVVLTGGFCETMNSGVKIHKICNVTGISEQNNTCLNVVHTKMR